MFRCFLFVSHETINFHTSQPTVQEKNGGHRGTGIRFFSYVQYIANWHMWKNMLIVSGLFSVLLMIWTNKNMKCDNLYAHSGRRTTMTMNDKDKNAFWRGASTVRRVLLCAASLEVRHFCDACQMIMDCKLCACFHKFMLFLARKKCCLLVGWWKASIGED
jgi:hypothetical protein